MIYYIQSATQASKQANMIACNYIVYNYYLQPHWGPRANG